MVAIVAPASKKTFVVHLRRVGLYEVLGYSCEFLVEYRPKSNSDELWTRKKTTTSSICIESGPAMEVRVQWTRVSVKVNLVRCSAYQKFATNAGPMSNPSIRQPQTWSGRRSQVALKSDPLLIRPSVSNDGLESRAPSEIVYYYEGTFRWEFGKEMQSSPSQQRLDFFAILLTKSATCDIDSVGRFVFWCQNCEQKQNDPVGGGKRLCKIRFR